MINKPLVTRYEGNPILTKHDIPYPVETVHNAGACKFNGRYLLLFRSHLRNGRSIIGIARSTDGYKFQVDPKPFMVPLQRNRIRSARGVRCRRPQISVR